MSKATQKVFGEIKSESAEKVGLGDVLKGVKDFVQDMAPGLTLEKIGSDIAHEFKQQVAFGSHEVAASLFTGSAFVMYPRAGKENAEQGKAVEGTDAPSPTPEMERDQGMER